MALMKTWDGTRWLPIGGHDYPYIILSDAVSSGVRFKMTMIAGKLSLTEVVGTTTPTSLPSLVDTSSGKRYSLAASGGNLTVVEL